MYSLFLIIAYCLTAHAFIHLFTCPCYGAAFAVSSATTLWKLIVLGVEVAVDAVAEVAGNVLSFLTVVFEVVGGGVLVVMLLVMVYASAVAMKEHFGRAKKSLEWVLGVGCGMVRLGRVAPLERGW
jgi:hypothetical protein